MRLGRIVALLLGTPVAVIAFLWFVPVNPAMIHPLYWQLADILGREELALNVENDVTSKVCPFVDRETIGRVAAHRPARTDTVSPTEEHWMLYEPKSLARICADFRLRVLSVRFDRKTEACSADAVVIPQCDF